LIYIHCVFTNISRCVDLIFPISLIAEAVKILFNENVTNVNTARTIYGKKAFVQFETTAKARDLATKIGML